MWRGCRPSCAEGSISGVPSGPEAVQVFGINLDDQLRVSDLEHRLCRAILMTSAVRPRALLGREMADRLQLDVGASFVLDALGESRR